MRTLFANQSLFLEAGRAASGIAGQSRTLRIMRGRAWLTVEGVAHDYWLDAGDSFLVPAGRLVVLEADIAAGELAASIEPDASLLAALAWQLRKALTRLSYRSDWQAKPDRKAPRQAAQCTSPCA